MNTSACKKQRSGISCSTWMISTICLVVAASEFLSLERKDKKFIVEKGSVSVNGVSLTVSKVNLNSFQITVIPHTLKLTNLINLKKGDIVNIEFDMVGKYLNNIFY